MDLDIDQLFYSNLDTNSSLVSSSTLYIYRLQRHIEFGLSIRYVGLLPPSFFSGSGSGLFRNGTSLVSPSQL